MASTHLSPEATDQGRRKCCVRSALNPDAAFCNDCGNTLVRCMAVAECGSLLDETGLCPVCVRPELSLDAGAAASVREGGKLALPLVITNASTVGRPLFITGLWMSEDDSGDPREIPLPFERLEPGGSANIAVRTGVLDYAGVHRIDLLMAVATRYRFREEEYIFSSSIVFPVESRDPDGPSVNVNVTAETVGAGFTVYNPTRIESDRAKGIEAHAAPIPLDKIRADEAERKRHRRGYENRLRVPRTVAMEWRGFDEGHAPFDGPNLATSGLLSFGRNAIDAADGGNDVRLAVSAADGGIDGAATLQISRNHFTLYVSSGRLMLRVDSQFGVRVNDESYGRTKTVLLNDGDTIHPLRKQPAALAITVDFEADNNLVNRIVLRRTSQAPRKS